MAGERLYSITGGLGSRFKDAVVEAAGADTGAVAVQVNVDYEALPAGANNKAEILRQLEAIKAYILEQPYPDA